MDDRRIRREFHDHRHVLRCDIVHHRSVSHGRIARWMWFREQLRWSLTEISYLCLNGHAISWISDRIKIDGTFIGQIVENVDSSDCFWS